MIAPDAALIAKILSPLPAVIAKSLSSVSPVVATVITATPLAAFSATLPVCPAVIARATSVIVIVIVSVSAAVPSVAETTRSYDESLSKSRFVLLLTVIAPVLDPIANIESSLPLEMDHVRLPASPVAATVTTEAPFEAPSDTEAEVSVTVTASFVTATVN